MLYKTIVETMVCDRVRDFGIPIPFRDLLVQFHYRRLRLPFIDPYKIFLYVYNYFLVEDSI